MALNPGSGKDLCKRPSEMATIQRSVSDWQWELARDRWHIHSLLSHPIEAMHRLHRVVSNDQPEDGSAMVLVVTGCIVGDSTTVVERP